MSFLRSPGNSQVQTPQYTGVQMQASSSALPIPILWGMTLVAPNVVWSGDFLASPQYSQPSGGKGGVFGGSGGGQITGYEYFSALVLGLCEGPIANVRWGYNGQDTYSLYQLNCSVLKGTTPQSPWSYLSANHPKRALAYPGTALVVSPSYDLGSSASVGSLSFEVVGAFSGTSVTTTDADPAQIVFDFLTNAQYGVGFPAASIDATTLNGLTGATYQAYCAAIGIGLSPVLTDQEAASSILARWLQLTNATAVWSGGRLKIVPFGDAPVSGTLNAGGTASFVPNTTPVYDLTDDDFIAGTDTDPVVVTRSDPYSTPNVVNLEVLSRAPTTAYGQVASQPNYYAPTPVQARDQNAIETYGLRIGPTVTAHEICTVGIGQIAAQLILQRALYVRNTYAFKLSWECCLLEPMDIVTLSDANLGLSKTPVRILEIAEDGDGLLDVTAEEYPGTIASTPGYPVDPSTNEGTAPRTVAPASVNAPILFEPPSELTGGIAQVRIGVSGGANGIADLNWGGAAIYASTDTITYALIGSATAPSRMGVLTAAVGAPPGATSDMLQVSFAESGATLVAASTPTLVLVDGEIMSFASATLTGANAYALGGLSRNLYGQQGGAHVVGAPVLVLDPIVFTWAMPQAFVGARLWLKLASFNVFGGMQQDLSACTAYPFAPLGSGVFGPVSQAIAAGTSFDEGLASAAVAQGDDDGLASDPYTRTLDMGLASEAAASLAVQLGGTGASSAAGARASLGAAASGANADISSLAGLTTPLSIGQGGTGGTTASGARGALGAAASGANADITSLLNVLKLQGGATQSLTIDPATGHVGLAGYSADANNALGVLGTTCLFAASTDSMRFTFSKKAAANDATLSFQTNYSARAHDGATPGGWPAARLADIIGRTSVADASYTVLATDRTVAFTALTVARTVTLPAAAAYPTGTQLLVVDESGACSFTSTIAITRAGSDTIDGATSAVINTPYGFLALTSNGAGKWTIVDFTGATTAQLTNRNAVINGNFAINQRGSATGTALAAGAYAHDRWKAGASGCTYSFTQAVPDTTINITAGSLIQAVDGPNVSATAWWLTWTGTATARIWQGSASGSFSAGIAMTIGGVAVNALLVTGLTPGTIANIEVSTGTLGLVQFEAALPGAGPTRFERRHNELALCQRYYFQVTANLYALQLAGYTASTTNGQIFATITLPVSMRSVPTLAFIGSWNNSTATAGIQAVGVAFITIYATPIVSGNFYVYNPSNGGFYASAEI